MGNNNMMRDGVAVLLACGVVAGLWFPSFAATVAPFVFPALFVLVTLSLALATDRPIGILTHPEPAVWGIMLWQMAFLPLLAILVGWAIDLPSDLHLMLLLTATSSSVFAAPTIAHLFQLNDRLPINGMVVSTFLMPISLLVFDQSLGGQGFPISLTEYVLRLVIFLLTPLALSILINRVIRYLPTQGAQGLHNAMRAGALLALLVFGVGIMDGVTAKFQSDPARVLSMLWVAVGFGVATLVGTICLFWSLGRDLVLAATVLSVHRNLGLTYAVVGTAVGHDFAIYVAIAQIPMFISPLAIRLFQLIIPRQRTQVAHST